MFAEWLRKNRAGIRRPSFFQRLRNFLPAIPVDEGNTMTRRYAAKITPGVGGSPIWVETPANDVFQAKKLIISIYAPRTWWRSPVRIA
jgi:hypothetical protein